MGRPFTGMKSVATFEQIKDNGTVYVYERTTWYDPSKGYSRSSRKLLGKKDTVTGEIVATRPKRDAKANEDITRKEEAVTVGIKSNAMISICSASQFDFRCYSRSKEGTVQRQGYCRKVTDTGVVFICH